MNKVLHSAWIIGSRVVISVELYALVPLLMVAMVLCLMVAMVLLIQYCVSQSLFAILN